MAVAECDMPIDGLFVRLFPLRDVIRSSAAPRRPKRLHVVGGHLAKTANAPGHPLIVRWMHTDHDTRHKDKLLPGLGKSSWDGSACGTGV